MKFYKAKKYSDLLGIISSAICFLHCLILPLLWVWYSAYSLKPWHLLDYLFIVLAGIAVYFSAKNTAFVFLKIGLWISYIIFAVSLIFHETVVYAHYISLSGSVALILCHTVNFKLHLQHHHSYAKAE